MQAPIGEEDRTIDAATFRRLCALYDEYRHVAYGEPLKPKRERRRLKLKKIFF